ncbi:claudin-8-like [Chanos chanos]|uniref:Claudin n=1 Tax=Chanos chanos TaxID=29144 RepID=A0A6J2VRR5_CHACN|nr:claudin-8-like [Chanos chanos]
MRGKLETLAMVLGFVGLVGTVVATAMPMWRVSAFIGANIIVMETIWEGLWMTCAYQTDIRMQCRQYYSWLILPPEMQAARVLMCVSVILAFFAVLVAGCGVRSTNCCKDNERGKNIVLVVGACMFLLSCLCTMIPVAWTTHTIIWNFYNPEVIDAEKHEIGAAIYVGWATCGVLLAAGVILICRYCPRQQKEEGVYYAPTSAERQSMVHLERKSNGSFKTMQYV